MTDSGVYGQRGYDGKLMFTWIEAAVDIPRKVYKHLGNLGAKLYFLRMPYVSKTEEELVKKTNEDFDTKFTEIQSDSYQITIHQSYTVNHYFSLLCP
jgi:hypothetical protein